MQMEDFLRLVLPDEGLYCWVKIRNGSPRQGHTETIEALANELRTIDASGADSYFGCASYATNEDRTKNNVLWVKSFWLDLDAGEGKDYETAEAAVEALDVFCSRCNIAPPLLVRSGYGVHCWWPLSKPLDKDTWVKYAKKLHSLCETYGFRVDQKRTRDCASILRAPGTHNHKYGTRSEVFIWDEDPDSYMDNDTDDFCRSLEGQADVPEIRGEICKTFDFTKGVNDGERTNTLTSLAGHLFATGHSYEACLSKIQKWNLFNTPPLPEEKVVHHVTGIWNTHKRNHPNVDTLPKVPYPYSWSENKLVLLDDSKEDEPPKTVVVTTQPVFLTDITKMEYTTNLAYIFRQYLPHDGWREFMVLASDFEGSGWFGYMAKAGADRGCISNQKLFKEFIGRQAQEMRQTMVESLRYEQFGWKNDKTDFLIGDVFIKAAGDTERVHVSEELYPRVKLLSVPPRASLSVWSSEANKLFSDALLPIGFGLVASFCSPILGLCMNQSDGGIVLHFMSEESGKGKSKLIEAAASAWGQLKSTRLTASDTINSQFKIISLNNNIPVQIDELQQIDPQMAVKLVKRFTVGEDKNRLKQTGELITKENSFQTLMTTTANYSLLEKLRASGDEGAVARVLEIVVDTPDGVELKGLDEITRVMNENCGVAAREFVARLVNPAVRNAVKAQYDVLKVQYSNIGGAENRYINRILAAVHITAALLVHYQILQFDPKRLINWLVDRCNERKAVSIHRDPPDLLSDFISSHSHECLSISGKYSPKNNSIVILNQILPRNVNLRYEKDSGLLYFPSSMISDWCNKNRIHFGGLKGWLKANDILMDTDALINLSAYTTIVSGRRRCWRVNMNHPSLSGVVVDSSQLNGESKAAGL